MQPNWYLIALSRSLVDVTAAPKNFISVCYKVESISSSCVHRRSVDIRPLCPTIRFVTLVSSFLVSSDLLQHKPALARELSATVSRAAPPSVCVISASVEGAGVPAQCALVVANSAL